MIESFEADDAKCILLNDIAALQNISHVDLIDPVLKHPADGVNAEDQFIVGHGEAAST